MKTKGEKMTTFKEWWEKQTQDGNQWITPDRQFAEAGWNAAMHQIEQEKVRVYDRPTISDSEKTQENLRAPSYEEYQKEVELGGVKVWADPELIPLLKALNEAGLTTRSHCCGHGDNPAWVAVKLDNVIGLDVRKSHGYDEVVLSWMPNRGISRNEST